MKTNVRWNVRFIAVAVALLWVAIVSRATATTPKYQIYDIGVIDPGYTASQRLRCVARRNCNGPINPHWRKPGVYLDSERRHCRIAEPCRAQLCRFEQRE